MDLKEEAKEMLALISKQGMTFCVRPSGRMGKWDIILCDGVHSRALAVYTGSQASCDGFCSGLAEERRRVSVMIFLLDEMPTSQLSRLATFVSRYLY